MQGRFVLHKTNSSYFFPEGKFDTIKILDFEYDIEPYFINDFYFKIFRNFGGGFHVKKEHSRISFLEFKQRFFDSKELIEFEPGAQIELVLGVVNENKEFFSLYQLTHFENIEVFRIDIGYEISREGFTSTFL